VFNDEQQLSVLAELLCCAVTSYFCLVFFKTVTISRNLRSYMNLDTPVAVGTQGEGVENRVLRIFGTKRDEVDCV
jgi:hypothetical protein